MMETGITARPIHGMVYAWSTKEADLRVGKDIAGAMTGAVSGWTEAAGLTSLSGFWLAVRDRATRLDLAIRGLLDRHTREALSPALPIMEAETIAACPPGVECFW